MRRQKSARLVRQSCWLKEGTKEQVANGEGECDREKCRVEMGVFAKASDGF